jgi:hypothetical protein
MRAWAPQPPVRLQTIWLAISFFFMCGSGYSQTNIHKEILETYSFQPHQLTRDQQGQKSVVLDSFWKKATERKSDYIPALRQELTDFSNPPFFLYDGSMLLMNLSQTAEDRKVVLAAIAHSDLRDIDEKAYFNVVHDLAAQGENTTAAAFHILEDPKFHIFVPEHVLNLAQNYCLIYMLMPTAQSYWEQASIDRLRTEKEPTAQQSLLLLLWYAQTEAADKAILSFVQDESNASASRDFARKLSVSSSTGNGDDAGLRKKRRERMRAVSDEALLDLDRFTRDLHKVRSR